MRQIMMICPVNDQWLPVSSVTRPVTQVADVAVNTASINGVVRPSREEKGNISRNPPKSIINANPVTRTRGGDQWEIRKNDNIRFYTPFRIAIENTAD